MDEMLEDGVIVTWRQRFGFIRPDGSVDGDDDVFVPATYIEPGVTPVEGLRVRFTRGIGRGDRICAIHVEAAE